MNDAFAVLGLPADATVEQIRTARRELAKQHHPDQGGDGAQMQTVNEAADQALRDVEGAVAESPTRVPRPSQDAPSTVGEPWSGVSRDAPSFTVEALPVETFEALLVVTSWIGEVLDDDPPYRLDVHLYDPTDCWCRLDLVPDAGASTVSLTVAGLDGGRAPNVLDIRDVWVANLNQIDWS